MKKMRDRSRSIRRGSGKNTSKMSSQLTLKNGRTQVLSDSSNKLSSKCNHMIIDFYRSDDDEDMFGRPIYKPEKDKLLPALL